MDLVVLESQIQVLGKGPALMCQCLAMIHNRTGITPVPPSLKPDLPSVQNFPEHADMRSQPPTGGVPGMIEGFSKQIQEGVFHIMPSHRVRDSKATFEVKLKAVVTIKMLPVPTSLDSPGKGSVSRNSGWIPCQILDAEQSQRIKVAGIIPQMKTEIQGHQFRIFEMTCLIPKKIMMGGPYSKFQCRTHGLMRYPCHPESGGTGAQTGVRRILDFR